MLGGDTGYCGTVKGIVVPQGRQQGLATHRWDEEPYGIFPTLTLQKKTWVYIDIHMHTYIHIHVSRSADLSIGFQRE